MSELNAEAKARQNSQQVSYDKQQRTEEKKFWRDLFNRANEFSKKIALIDTFAYIILIVILLVVMWIRPDLAAYCVQIVPYLTTTVVTLRTSYTVKAGIENWKKINASISTEDTETTINTEETSQG